MSDSRALGGGPADDGLPDVPEKPTVPTPAKDRTKASATRTRDHVARQGDKRPGFFRRIAIFVSQVVAEMKKVTYPTKTETWTYFVVVIVFVALIMAYTGLLDLGFGRLNTLIFG
ncbi:preprotein translocase subunit SecE [Actinomyces sp.]|uniref:preprotein translocase subunit SecE n=1 Tax=Actinomyces sp. TaxID=29317 RepID=UPI0028A24AEA|nr:preprotein translocase subunit SecE [Actinomyces sp.]